MGGSTWKAQELVFSLGTRRLEERPTVEAVGVASVLFSGQEIQHLRHTVDALMVSSTSAYAVR